MKILFVILMFILIISLQLAFFSIFNFSFFSLNLVLSGVLAYAIFRQEKKNYWLILIFILIYDLLAGNPFGFFSFGAWVSFFFIDWLGRVLFKQNNILSVSFLMLIGISFFELFLFGLVRLAGFFHFGTAIFNTGNFLAFFVINFIGNGIFGLLFWFLLNKYSKIISLKVWRKV